MKILYLIISLLFSLYTFSQNEQLAQYYFEKGEFEKAKVSYEELLKGSPGNYQHFLKVVECYQQLQQLDTSKKLLEERLKMFNESYMLIELGYNYQLQNDMVKSKECYHKALDHITENPMEVYNVAYFFDKKGLPQYALDAYLRGYELIPDANFNYAMGLLYGQLGDMEKMIFLFLEESFKNRQNTAAIQSQFIKFMADEGSSNFNNLLRKTLITKAQENQDVFWNEYLSWFYAQQKEYDKVFIQEKAIYKRNPESLSRIFSLAELTFDEDYRETSEEILNFILQNTKDLATIVRANTLLLKIRIQTATEKDYAAINFEIELLLTTYGNSVSTLSIQIIQAHFVSFYLKKTDEGRAIINKILELPLDPYQRANAKMELADILLFDQKFNQALIYYTQIETDLPNDALSHEAAFRSARTSYFKGDFVWALKQFKELKSASTQLIANDALEYFMLISDNKDADSTQTALKEFSKGDFLLFQNKNMEATAQFELVSRNYKGNEIEAVTNLRLGKIAEKENKYEVAINFYKQIIDNYSDGIYMDDALFLSAEIYNNKLQLPEKAKPLYEKIIFSHQDSIYFVDARRVYRNLRGDTNI